MNQRRRQRILCFDQSVFYKGATLIVIAYDFALAGLGTMMYVFMITYKQVGNIIEYDR